MINDIDGVPHKAGQADKIQPEKVHRTSIPGKKKFNSIKISQLIMSQYETKTVGEVLSLQRSVRQCSLQLPGLFCHP